MNKNILVVAAHPDDEILGCGGTICRHVQNGDKVHVLILAEGITSRDKIRDQNHRAKDLNLLTETAYQANEILGVTSLIFKKFPDNRLDSIDRIDIIKSIEAVIQKLTPTIIYTHFGGDLNIDHQIVNQSVITACRPQPDSCVKTLLFLKSLQVQNGKSSVPETHLPLTGLLIFLMYLLKK